MNRIIKKLKNEGFFKTLAIIAGHLKFHFRAYLDASFDRRYGTDTSGIQDLNSLDIENENVRYGVHYEPTPRKAIDFVLNEINIDYSDFVFVDLGSGKGRVLLQASNFPFSSIVGVEFSEKLNAIAQRNIQIYREKKQQCFDIQSKCMDAAEFEFPAKNVVVFLFNPFHSEILGKVLNNLKHSASENHTQAIVIYYNPLIAEAFERDGLFARKIDLQMPYDWSLRHQRKAFVYYT
jgi:16S rRNA G966 N2-methylase RsmD